MKKEGKVIKTFDNKARVLVNKQSACSKCDKDCDLAEDHESGEVIIEVDNEMGVRKGEKVKLEMQESSLVSAAIIIYMFPLLAAILGYFVGDWITVIFSIEGEIMGIVGTLLFLGISFLIIKLLNPRFESQRKFKPRITKIINSKSNNKNNNDIDGKYYGYLQNRK